MLTNKKAALLSRYQIQPFLKEILEIWLEVKFEQQ